MPAVALSLNSGFGIFFGLLFVVLLASLMTILLSWLLLSRYKKSVGQLMLACGNSTSHPAEYSRHEADDTLGPGLACSNISADSHADLLYRRMIAGPWLYAARYALAGMPFAVVMSVSFGMAFSQAQINPLGAADHPLQFLLMGWLFAWPVVVAALLITKLNWQNKCALLCGYFVILIILGALLTLMPTEAISLWGKRAISWSGETPARVAAKWFMLNIVPTLLLVTFRNRRIRAVAPLVLAFMTAVATGLLSVLLWLVINHQHFQAASDFLTVAFAMRANTAFIITLILITLAACGVFAVLGGWLSQKIRQGYLAKSLSDLSLSLDAVWLLFASCYAIVLALAGPGWAVFGIAAFLLYKFSLKHTYKLLPSHQSDAYFCPTLLVLRVFSLGKRSEILFDTIAAYWRYIGTIQLIAGTDLAQSTVAPHQFLSFITGKLKGLFIDSEAAVNRSIRAIDHRPDADGRFRINDFLCHQDTWQSVLSKLVAGNDVVLMDLRNFQPENQGCIFEINQLLQSVSVHRLVLVVDNTTDRQLFREVLLAACAGLPLGSPNSGISADEVQLFELKSDHAKALRMLLMRLSAAAGGAKSVA